MPPVSTEGAAPTATETTAAAVTARHGDIPIHEEPVETAPTTQLAKLKRHSLRHTSSQPHLRRSSTHRHHRSSRDVTQLATQSVHEDDGDRASIVSPPLSAHSGVEGSVTVDSVRGHRRHHSHRRQRSHAQSSPDLSLLLGVSEDGGTKKHGGVPAAPASYLSRFKSSHTRHQSSGGMSTSSRHSPSPRHRYHDGKGSPAPGPREQLLTRPALKDGFDDFCVGINVPLDHLTWQRIRTEIHLCELEMPGLMEVRHRYGPKQPLSGANIIVCLHISAQTMVLIETLQALGATIRWCSANIASTNDEIAAYAAGKRIPVYGWTSETEDEYWWCIRQAIDHDEWEPNMVMEDGGDVVSMIHQKFPDKAPHIRGVTDESSIGVHRLHQMAMTGRLRCPAMNIADSVTKSKFDNYYCVREVLVDALKRATDVMLAGKTCVVSGYGDVGKACASALHRMGAIVIVTECDPICALQACMEGYRVMPMDKAASQGDVFVTATGNKEVITRKHFDKMRSKAIVCNMGHYDLEIDVASLTSDNSLRFQNIKPNVDHIIWPNGKEVILLAQGRLLSLAFGAGRKPSFVMSQSFTNQVLAQIELFTAPRQKYQPEVYRLPRHLDEKVARFHLEKLGADLENLTEGQAQYLGIPKEGPFKERHYRY